jgi:hypothetical protein
MGPHEVETRFMGQIDVVQVWRLDGWVRLVTDLLARLQAHYKIRSYHRFTTSVALHLGALPQPYH